MKAIKTEQDQGYREGGEYHTPIFTTEIWPLRGAYGDDTKQLNQALGLGPQTK